MSLGKFPPHTVNSIPICQPLQHFKFSTQIARKQQNSTCLTDLNKLIQEWKLLFFLFLLTRKLTENLLLKNWSVAHKFSLQKLSTEQQIHYPNNIEQFESKTEFSYFTQINICMLTLSTKNQHMDVDFKHKFARYQIAILKFSTSTPIIARNRAQEIKPSNNLHNFSNQTKGIGEILLEIERHGFQFDALGSNSLQGLRERDWCCGYRGSSALEQGVERRRELRRGGEEDARK